MERYIIPLILTIIIESVVIYSFGFRGKDLLMAAIGVNIITNPTLNLIFSHTLNIYADYGMGYILFLEAIVVIVEYFMLKAIIKKEDIPFFRLSLTMNVTSFLVGILLLW